MIPDDEHAPTRTPITEGLCWWAMTYRSTGEQYPHGIKARWRVRGAGEFLDGDYCSRHADMAMDYAARGIEVGP